MPRARRLLLLAALAAVAGGCADEDSPPKPAAADAPAEREGPPHARWEIVDALRESRDLAYHAADGGGRAWLEQAEPASPVAGGSGRFTIVYEVGPLGIATGGMIQLQVSPFWEWSTPQVEVEQAPGYTTVQASAPDIQVEAGTLDQQLLGIEVTGRPLVAGDRVTIVYGAGEAGARVDRYAERGSRFWIGVDGDGDGVRKLLPDSPAVDVLPGPPALLQVLLPSVGRPGEEVDVTLAVLDRSGNAGAAIEGRVSFPEAEGIELPQDVELGPEDRGRRRVRGVLTGSGVVRVEAEGPDGLVAESNPLVVSANGPRVLWADLHGHSHLSDGTGTSEDYFAYARDVAALDVVALTDHDHWGMQPLEAHPEMWDEIRANVGRFHDPGRFVTILGYEWTSWIYGHRHVLYFDDEESARVYSSVDPDFESPLQLWRALEGREALTFAHHSAGGPIPTDWDIPPDPRFEPVTEIVSVHGSSEALDSPFPIYNAVGGNFARDVLDRGYRLGFVGSGDSHDGHPGLAHLASPAGGGVAAILAEEKTRASVLEALRARRVYATNGPRIVLRTALGVHGMGASVPAGPGGTLTEPLYVRVVAPAPLERLDLVRSGRLEDSIALEGRREVALERLVDDLEPGEYLYVRAVQMDGGAAWSSPIFIE